MAANPSRAGYPFRPTDVELLNHFLRSKINGDVAAVRKIPELDIRKFEPWDLRAQSPPEAIDNEWFFFYPMKMKYKKGDRLDRMTEKGYWKPTGSERHIKSADGTVIGTKRTLVFRISRGAGGQKTDWYMYEYRSEPEQGCLLLGKLIKKADKRLDRGQDETNIAETNVSSSAIAGDLQSEPVTLMMNAQAEKIASTSARCLPENSDSRMLKDHSYTADGAGDKITIQTESEPEGQMLRMEMEVGPPFNCPVAVPEDIDEQEFEDILASFKHNSGMNSAVEIEAPNFESDAEVGQQQDFDQQEIWTLFDEPVLELLDDNGKIFSPSHVHYPVPYDMGYGHKDQDGINEEDTNFVCSILVGSDQTLAFESAPPNYVSNAELNQAQFETDVEGYGQFSQNNKRAPAPMEMPVGAKPVTAKAEEPEEKYSMPLNVVADEKSNGTSILQSDTVPDVKTFWRCQSESMERESPEKPCGKLRQSETEKCMKVGEVAADAVCLLDELSNEEFQRAVEEFIAKQLKFHQEEFAIVAC